MTQAALHSLQSHFTVYTPLNHHNEAQKGSTACLSSHSQRGLATIQIHLQHLTHVLTPRHAPRGLPAWTPWQTVCWAENLRSDVDSKWAPGKFCQVWLLRVPGWPLERAMQVGWAWEQCSQVCRTGPEARFAAVAPPRGADARPRSGPLLFPQPSTAQKDRFSVRLNSCSHGIGCLPCLEASGQQLSRGVCVSMVPGEWERSLPRVKTWRLEACQGSRPCQRPLCPASPWLPISALRPGPVTTESPWGPSMRSTQATKSLCASTFSFFSDEANN